MRNIRAGAGFTIFVIFFGVAVLEAFADGDIVWIAVWLLLGLLFLVTDNIRRPS